MILNFAFASIVFSLYRKDSKTFLFRKHFQIFLFQEPSCIPNPSFQRTIQWITIHLLKYQLQLIQRQDAARTASKVIAILASGSDNQYIDWKGQGEIPADKLEKMREYIRRTHAEGKLFRWWGAPDKPLFKKLFIKEGVDLIGADDLNTLSQILQDHQ